MHTVAEVPSARLPGITHFALHTAYTGWGAAAE